jgi:addiction module HigA family antidote
MSVYELAKRLSVTRSRLNDIVLERRAVTAETALRLSKALGTTPEYWMRLQIAYDLEQARNNLKIA